MLILPLEREEKGRQVLPKDHPGQTEGLTDDDAGEEQSGAGEEERAPK